MTITIISQSVPIISIYYRHVTSNSSRCHKATDYRSIVNRRPIGLFLQYQFDRKRREKTYIIIKGWGTGPVKFYWQRWGMLTAKPIYIMHRHTFSFHVLSS